jgi:D-sedoheptulose 7-phosphate isomerase
MTTTILQELEQAQQTLANFISDKNNIATIEQAAIVMANAIKAGGKIISCGNGGSMCDAMHFAEELTGRYRDNRRALPAISISDVSHMSCVGNDYGYEYAFSRYVEALGNANDVLLAISTSGNSGNVLKATEAAKAKDMKVVGLTGKDGGKLAPLCDVEIRVPHMGYADRVQEIHIKVIHILILLLEKQLVSVNESL